MKTWGVKVAVAVCSGGSSSSGGLLRRRPSASPGVMRGAVKGVGASRDGLLKSPPGASGVVGRGGIGGPGAGGGPGGGGGGSGAPSPLRLDAHLAWWDGVSHAVTRPGSRDRHLTREHVTLADVLAGQVTCSAATRRSRGPRRPAPPRPGRRDAHSAPENDGRTTVVQPHMNGPHRRAPP